MTECDNIQIEVQALLGLGLINKVGIVVFTFTKTLKMYVKPLG